MANKNNSRKQKSIDILRSENVPYVDFLHGHTEGKLRKKVEIVRRAICLMIVAVRAEGLEKDRTLEVVKELEAAKYLSAKERAFLEKDHFDFQDKVKFLWRYEALWVLLWALGYVKTLERPESICDVVYAVTIIRDNGLNGLIANARLRELDEILDVADLMYRYHWATTDERIKGHDAPAGLDGSVVYERRYALEWLVSLESVDWDDVPMHT